ncbi:MAG: SRPBCC family protein [Chitinophagaceae bacterium]
MKIFEYTTEQLLPVDIDTAWNFFSSAKNLALITPGELNFKILTTLDDKEIYKGMIIDYTVKPFFGIPLRWKTEICNVDKPFSFTDRQLRGPYRVWEHKHIFIGTANGLLVKDKVKYQLPMGLIGRLSHRLVVRKKIENIFSYRRQMLHKIFVNNEYAVS